MIRILHRPALMLIGLVAMLATSASGDPLQGDGKTSPAPRANPYAIVNYLGEADQQVTLKDGKLLTHRRTADPFGIAIRGKFKGLPPVAEHPSGVSSQGQPNTSPVATDVLTLEKA